MTRMNKFGGVVKRQLRTSLLLQVLVGTSAILTFALLVAFGLVAALRPMQETQQRQRIERCIQVTEESREWCTWLIQEVGRNN